MNATSSSATSAEQRLVLEKIDRQAMNLEGLGGDVALGLM